MSALSESQIDAIARRVAERMRAGAAPPAPSLGDSVRESLARGGALPMGVFRTIDECVAAAQSAFSAFSKLGLEKRKVIIASIRESMMAHAISLAREAREETGQQLTPHQRIGLYIQKLFCQ